MRNTGERYIPALDAARISYEHWHRYLFAARYVAGRAVLDVASGEGYGADFLARTAASVVGVDLSAEAVAHARARYPRANLTFHEGPAEAVPVSGEHLFDVITSFETLEHLSPEGQSRFVAEVRRLLRPGGLLLVSTPNRLVYTERGGLHNPFHLREFAPDEFAAFLGDAFPAVRILSQQVYPGSYLWDTDPAGSFTEYQLGLRDGEYRPLDGDGKETLYLLAVCSDDPVEPPGPSLLLDADAAGGERDDGGHVSTLFFDTGAGFRAEDSVAVRLPPGPFRLTFQVGGAVVRGLRWDPLELQTCRVWLEAVEWADPDGGTHPIDPAGLAANGTADEAGGWGFDTPDPMVFLPVAGAVDRVTLVGRYEADDAPATAARVAAAVAGREAEARGLADRLRESEGQVAALTARARELAAVVAARDERVAELEAHAQAVADVVAARDGQVAEMDAHARELAAAVHLRDGQVAALTAHARELADGIGDRDGRVAELDAHARGLAAAVAARDARVAELDAHVRELAAAVHARDARVAELTDIHRRSRFGPLVSTLFFDTGAGFRAEECRSAPLPRDPGPFRVAYELGGAAVRGLRWDPLELRTCRVRLEVVEWEDTAGGVHRVDPAGLTANGATDAGGWAFDTADPMVFVPAAGAVGRVTVAGWYEADDAPASAVRAAAALAAATGRAADLTAALADRDELLRAADDRVRALAEQVRALTAAQEAARWGGRTSVLQIDAGAGCRATDSRS